jgi:2-dehydro-3-deoxyphosphogluconate aldolase / (4S)-4-hydroxy-2-oxoglutarate aldolase
MAKYKRFEVMAIANEQGVVPLFYHEEAETCKKVVKACYDGGARLFEFTNRGDFAHEIFSDLSKYAQRELPGLVLGVGSVVDAPTAALYIQLGANFVVSPLLNADMAKVCNRRNIPWIPGCATLSEINYAEELGAAIVKIFPGNTTGGPQFVKAVKAPCPWSLLMPSGGVTTSKENLAEWFKVGVFCVGMGSSLISNDDVQNHNYDAIRKKVSEVLKFVEQVKNEQR